MAVRRRRRLPGAVLLLAVSGALAAGCGTGGARTSGADPDALHVSPGGDDAGTCVAASPCRTFARAYAVATPGRRILVAPGVYPGQRLPRIPGRAGADVVLSPDGGDVTVSGELRIAGDRVEVRGMTLAGGWYAEPGADRVTLRDDVARHLFITGASRVSVIGGSVGPGVDYHPQIQAAPGSRVPPRDVLIDGVTFHDWTRSRPGIHTECLQVLAGDGIVIRNSLFRGCDVMDLQISHHGDSPETRDVLVENDVFGETGSGGFHAVLAGNYRGLVIRYDSALQSIVVDPSMGGAGGARVVGNVAPITPGTCTAGVTYSHNVWDGGTCGPTDRNRPPGFADPAALDLHPAPGSAAVDAGDPADFPPADFDGRPRPAGAAPDAGAFESRGGG